MVLDIRKCISKLTRNCVVFMLRVSCIYTLGGLTIAHGGPPLSCRINCCKSLELKKYDMVLNMPL